MLELLFIVVPLAIFIGWCCGRYRQHIVVKRQNRQAVATGYFLGLNNLNNDQADQALDRLVELLHVNKETIETHLALGSLFRRRGELDRAIRLHQNLIVRPQLSLAQRQQALLELAQDYLNAGVLDRAEQLFLQVIDLKGDLVVSYQSLINLYQAQHEWQLAIDTLQKLREISTEKFEPLLAHYYCELTEQALAQGDFVTGQKFLAKALAVNTASIRVQLLLGKVALQQQKYIQAIQHFQQIRRLDSAFVTEVLPGLITAYDALNQHTELVALLEEWLQFEPQISCALVLANYCLAEQHDVSRALRHLQPFLGKPISWQNLMKIALFYIKAFSNVAPDFTSLAQTMDEVLKVQERYHCLGCGFKSNLLYWQCPSCRRWDAIKPL